MLITKNEKANQLHEQKFFIRKALKLFEKKKILRKYEKILKENTIK